jgi:Rrf2 family protein
MLSRKTKYGLKAMLALARDYGKGPVLISELAEREKIPEKFLQLILLELRNQGFLQSKKGRGGGYFLGRDPREVVVGHVIRVLDGPLAPVPCVSQTAYQTCEECRDEESCAVRMLMQEVRDATARILDGVSLADVVGRMDRAKALRLAAKRKQERGAARSRPGTARPGKARTRAARPPGGSR